jgi:hypothetical protein
MEDEESVDFLFDPDIAAYGQIDDGAGDIAGMNAVVESMFRLRRDRSLGAAHTAALRRRRDRDRVQRNTTA